MTPALATTPCHYFWQNSKVTREFRTAISLHSHTSASRECLDFIPRYSRCVPVLQRLVARHEARYAELHGTAIDYKKAWWTPPLTPAEAYHLEQRQIEDKLGLQALVSLTDHDDITAPSLLTVMPEFGAVPISVEWTVPYENSFLHLGIHNLPSRWAPFVMERLTAFTENPNPDELPELFCILNGFPSTLVVFNHPLWDERGIGQDAHRALATRFAQTYREWIHALELNGLRSWDENGRVKQMAESFDIPLISGGDRHGCEPNALVNITSAQSFAEFANEIRHDLHSTILYMDQYREPLRYRLIQGLLDAVREYQEFPEGRRRWTDRVYFKCEDGVVRKISALWDGDGPPLVKLFMVLVRLMESSKVRGALRVALAERQEVST